MWNKETIHEAVNSQRAYFESGQTLDISWRKEQLVRLKMSILAYEEEIEQALEADLGRTAAEAYLTDIGPSIVEINEALHHLKKWSRPEVHYSGAACFPSMITKVYKMPYGTCLIISPFNFPFLLTFGILAACIVAGNTAVIKPSSKSAASTAVIEKITANTFPPEYCTVISGGHDIADLCLKERFDKIFYTGSPKVGRHVMACAAENLTPVGLELGGETGNWCIVRKDANIKDAARKIAFFKILNAGQICININQVAVAEEVADQFIEELKKEFTRQIGNAVNNPEYPKLISEAAYGKCSFEAEQYRAKIVYGGYGNRDTLKYAPTILYPVGKDEPVVEHELFSPLLPVVPFKDAEIADLLSTIAGREHGLALYLFTKDIKWAESVMSTQQYGGGCVNEVCNHLMVKGVPFNGTGHSGMGAYHGEWGFREFSHPSTVLYGSRFFNLPLREHPYSGKKAEYKMKLLRLFEK